MSADSENAYTLSFDKSAFNAFITCYSIKPNDLTADIPTFLLEIKTMAEELVLAELALKRSVKIWLCLVVVFDEFMKEGELKQDQKGHFSIPYTRCLVPSAVSTVVEEGLAQISLAVDGFETKGSSVVIKNIQGLELHVAKYDPLSGSSYVELPEYLKRKHAIVNPQNFNDNMCFKWCVLAATTPTVTHHRERISQYRTVDSNLDFSEVCYPVEIDKISAFEKKNQLSVNVYEYDEGLRPLHLSEEQNDPLILLLLYEGHYCLIVNFDKLVHDQNNHQHKGFYCPFCMIAQHNKNRFTHHLKRCRLNQITSIEMPDETNNILKFQNVHKMLRSPLVVYADAECYVKSMALSEPDPTRSSTTKFQHHIPYAFGCVTSISCCQSAKFGNYKVFTGDLACEFFLQHLVRIANEFRNSGDKPLVMSPADEAQFQAAETCFVCDERLECYRVRDHCHVCGRYRGALHNHCNQGLRLSKDLTVVFHNLRRYDGHLLMQHIGTLCNDLGLKLDCIAKGPEDYITFALRKRGLCIRFIDSCQFLLSSLENLAKSLADDQFVAVRKFVQPFDKLLLRKQVFPYDYVDGPMKLQERALPPKDAFFNKLTDEGISDEDYQHAQRIWSFAKISTMQEYAELYLKIDVLLTADVFEGFRSLAIATYKLDPCQYVTLPSYAFDACLRLTKMELELLTDQKMYEFFEAGIKGGVSVVTKRYAEAKNKYIDGYEGDDSSYIVDIDENNLYGCGMKRKCAVGDYKWRDPKTFKLSSYDPNGNVGYVLCVDLTYPEKLHDRHNCYPLAPERLTITEDMVSPYTRGLAEKFGIKFKNVSKLVPNFLPKKKYIVLIDNLLFYLEEGLELDEIHQVLEFRQEAWMAPYIDLNTELRKQAKTPFEKDLFKLFNNSVYGKTFENPRKYVNVELVTDETRLRKVVKKPEFQRCDVFSENLVACVSAQTKVLLNKPIYIGFCVLEISKLIMYQFHYRYMKPKFEDKLSLLLTDTDSYIYEVRVPDFYQSIQNDIDEHFDTSDYPKDHFLYSTKNKKVLGKMSDETAGIPIEEFVGLRSKMYSFRYGNVENKRAKGVKKSVVKRNIHHKDYVEVLKNETCRMDRMNLIRSFGHDIFTVSLNKRSLCCYDDKRYILPDGVNTLAYGHYKINQLQ